MQQQDAERHFSQIIAEHELLLYKVCRIYARTQADREDLFQDIVIQLWKSYPRFKGECRLGTWLYRVALNTAISGLRKQRDFITSYEPDSLPVHLPDEYSARAEEEQLARLYKAIEQLTEVEKAIVMLYMDNHSYAEMEDILGISQGTLRVKMSRIKDKIRQLTQNT